MKQDSVVLDLQGILKELVSSHDDEKLGNLSDRALQLLEQLPALDCGQRESKAVAMQLYTAGISLWNKTVALKSASAIALQLNAQLRHIACSLVLLASPDEISDANIKKQITMTTKTGRAWLDCSNPTMAEASLALATECCEKLRSKFPATTKEQSNSKAFFRVLCFRAEAAQGLDQHEVALEYIQQAKELLHLLEAETAYLSMLCYNFGLEMFQKGSHQQSVIWLKESYEIGRGCANVGAIKQGRTLRLLANAFLEWDKDAYWQKALNAIGLANSEHSHPAGLLLKTSILLQHDGSSERLSHAFEDTLKHPDLSTEMALATVRLTTQNNRYDLAFPGIRLLTRRYQNLPDLPQVQLLHLELLLEKDRRAEAKELVEECIIGHNTGSPLDVEARKHLHLILWEQAAQEYEKSEYAESLQWYNYSLSLFPASEERDKNIAKLQRNRCSCYIQLKDYGKATNAIEQAKKHDSNSPQTHFLIFKLALLQNKEQEAVESLSAMESCSSEEDASSSEEDCVSGLICLAAQLAFEHSSRDLAVLALERLVERSSHIQQVFTALRCLIRLKLTMINSDAVEKMSALSVMLSYITKAQAKLSKLPSVTIRQNEAGWFLKIAWNLALQCNENHQEMANFFIACYELSSHVQADSTVLQRQKTCQLLAAAANLQVARGTINEEERARIFESVLENIASCRSVCCQMGMGGVRDPSDPTHSLLALYEFEAKLKLGHQDLDNILEQITKLPSVEPKTFETVAALCVHSPGPHNCHAIGMSALRTAIRSHLQASPIDGERLSKCYHSLVQFVMGSESTSDMAAKEQAWNVLEEILGLLNQSKEIFPEMEVLWFLAKAWNCGIHLYSSLRFKEAEHWCSLGMRFLKHLSGLKSTYEEQMTGIYTEVLQKVQSQHLTLHTLQ